MKLNRREFLRAMTISTAGAAVWGINPAFSSGSAWALPGGDIRYLVKIFFTGGADALAWTPYDLPSVRARRSTIEAPASSFIDLGHEYVKLSGELANLYTRWGDRMAIFPGTVGEVGGSGSHAVARQNEATGSSPSDGQSVMGRMLVELAKSEPSPFLGWTFSSTDAFHLASRTLTPVVAPADLSTYNFLPYDLKGLGRNRFQGAALQEAKLQILYQTHLMGSALDTTAVPDTVAGQRVKASFEAIHASMDAVRTAHQEHGTRSVQYPDTDFGKQLKSIATLLDAGMGRCFYLPAPGAHDTHQGQRGSVVRYQASFTAGLDAFLTDLAATGNLDKTVIMCIGEFGRQITENSSGGTDHGRGQSAFLIGGRIHGGLYGPVASEDELATSYAMPARFSQRNIVFEIAEKMGLDPHIVLPNQNFARTPIGCWRQA